jgi:hypothetical protein
MPDPIASGECDIMASGLADVIVSGLADIIVSGLADIIVSGVALAPLPVWQAASAIGTSAAAASRRGSNRRSNRLGRIMEPSVAAWLGAQPRRRR